MKKKYMRVLASMTFLIGAKTPLGSQPPPIPKDLPKTLVCRRFGGGWTIKIYRDSQFQGLQVSGLALNELGQSLSAGFAFPVTASETADTVTLVSGRVNKDQTRDSITLTGGRAVLKIQEIFNFSTRKPLLPVNETVHCA